MKKLENVYQVCYVANFVIGVGALIGCGTWLLVQLLVQKRTAKKAKIDVHTFESLGEQDR